MADIAQLARTLNAVESVGQARAALEVATREADHGLDLVDKLSLWSTPDPAEATSTLSIDRSQLTGELGTLEAFAPTSRVDAATWSRQRRAIERTFIDVSGIEGVVGALDQIDFLAILGQAIANAPKVFGEAAGDVLAGAGRAAGELGGGFFSGIGVLGTLVLIFILLVVLRGRIAS